MVMMSPTHLPRIAVVEDDVDLCASTVDFLATLGYAVWGVGSGTGFYRRMAVEPVDVVVLDVELPGEDGFSIAGELRRRADVGVVMVTGRGELDDRLRGLSGGADAYMVKPANLRELAANIDAVARRLERFRRAESNPAWRLQRETWQWIAPDGAGFTLTAKEFLFVLSLVEAGGNTVTKAQLAARLDGQATSPNFNRLDVLLARLRKKGRQFLGCDLPIKAVTAIGFAVTARCLIV